MVLLAKHDGFPARRLEARVDALRFYTDLIEKILIALNVRAARGTDLHESQPLLVSGIGLEKTLQGAEALEDSLGVVNAIDTHAEGRGRHAHWWAQRAARTADAAPPARRLCT